MKKRSFLKLKETLSKILVTFFLTIKRKFFTSNGILLVSVICGANIVIKKNIPQT